MVSRLLYPTLEPRIVGEDRQRNAEGAEHPKKKKIISPRILFFYPTVRYYFQIIYTFQSVFAHFWSRR